jgi:hypothetical protein
VFAPDYAAEEIASIVAKLRKSAGMSEHERRLFIGARTVGSWKRSLGKAEVAVEASLFAPLDEAASGRLEAAAERFSRFFGLPAG